MSVEMEDIQHRSEEGGDLGIHKTKQAGTDEQQDDSLEQFEQGDQSQAVMA